MPPDPAGVTGVQARPLNGGGTGRQAGPGDRLVDLDRLRGVLILLMALDHAVSLVHRGGATEGWGVPPPDWQGDDIAFLVRFVTHVCAPGLFLTMGAALALFAGARDAAGWSQGRITRFVLIRGALLIGLQVTLENGAWLVGLATTQDSAYAGHGGWVPGGGGSAPIYLGVLFGLGASMMLWAGLLRLPSRWILPLSLVLLAIPAVLVEAVLPPRDPGPVLAALAVPSHGPLVLSFYPVLPWAGIVGLGIVFGRALAARPEDAVERAPLIGLGLLGLFVAFRLIEGPFTHHDWDRSAGWIGFLNLTKYPPSPSFLALTLGLALVLIWSVRRLHQRFQPEPDPRDPLLVFGRAPLAFYQAHLWLFAGIGALVPQGTSLDWAVRAWIFGTAALYFPCLWYGRWKQRRPVTSVWRLL